MTRPEIVGTAVMATRLRKRPDFLRTAGGRKVHAALFTVQAVQRPDGEGSGARVGFTVTKKVGNAVERNRVKRRLREVVRISPDLGIKPTHDYVIVGRRTILVAPFFELAAGLRQALGRLDRGAKNGGHDRRSGAPRNEAEPRDGVRQN